MIPWCIHIKRTTSESESEVCLRHSALLTWPYDTLPSPSMPVIIPCKANNHALAPIKSTLCNHTHIIIPLGPLPAPSPCAHQQPVWSNSSQPLNKQHQPYNTHKKYLAASGSSSLAALPSSIGNLKNLKVLNLHRTKHLSDLPETFGNLHSLEKLELSRSCFFQELVSKGNSKALKILHTLDHNRIKAQFSLCWPVTDKNNNHGDKGAMLKLWPYMLSNAAKLYDQNSCSIKPRSMGLQLSCKEESVYRLLIVGADFFITIV